MWNELEKGWIDKQKEISVRQFCRWISPQPESSWIHSNGWLAFSIFFNYCSEVPTCSKFTSELSNSKRSFQNAMFFVRRLPDETKSAPASARRLNSSYFGARYILKFSSETGHLGCSAQVVFMKTKHIFLLQRIQKAPLSLKVWKMTI